VGSAKDLIFYEGTFLAIGKLETSLSGASDLVLGCLPLFYTKCSKSFRLKLCLSDDWKFVLAREVYS
jgi:hypothetical protein